MNTCLNVDFTTLDPVIEWGRTDTYTYKKYASGLIEQTIYRSYTGAVSTLWNGVRISGIVAAAAFPVPMIKINSHVTSASPAVGQPDANVFSMSGGSISLTNTSGMYIVSQENISASRTYIVSTTVTGTWK